MPSRRVRIMQGLVLAVMLPCVSLATTEWLAWRKELLKPRYRLANALNTRTSAGVNLPPYVIDMQPLLALPFGTLDENGVLYNTQTRHSRAAYQPTSIAQYALAQWNAYLATGDEGHRDAFMIQANWLVANEEMLSTDMSGWSIPFPAHDYVTKGTWLSALTQGNCISVLVRSYRLTGEERFLHAAQRALRTFAVDIRDGGVRSCVADDGVFFEEVATYPATHILNGYILALFGLYDYVELTGDVSVEALIQHSLKTLHTLLDGYDVGYWSRYDLHIGSLATPFYHSLHVELLKALARYSHCTHCLELAARWDVYQQNALCHLRYFVVSRLARYQRGIRRVLFTAPSSVGRRFIVAVLNIQTGTATMNRRPTEGGHDKLVPMGLSGGECRP